jgi:lipopolysaccharide/colanic/teichoic acid biosynthesis glycosyltransferase
MILSTKKQKKPLVLELVVFRRSAGNESGRTARMKDIVSDQIACNTMLNARLSKCIPHRKSDIGIAIPENWNAKPQVKSVSVILYNGRIDLPKRFTKHQQKGYILISNGLYSIEVDRQVVDRLLADTDADVIAVNACGKSSNYCQRIRMTSSGKVAGIRRYFSACYTSAGIPSDWPHMVFMKNSMIDKIEKCDLTATFDTFAARCDLAGLKVRCFNAVANVTDLPDDKDMIAGDSLPCDNFRRWSRLSYVRTVKRIADVIFSSIVLMLFAPFLPIIAAAIKFNSPGPIFYKDIRQGIYGKPIKCLKFRSMFVSSDKIQDKLRVANQVDGPQFKMESDPRITAVGRFLRETYIDEIPQFINVLLGQMSVVGPRPSPERENRLCPVWRDARLSVRPGITGLWQVCRTRLPGRDFQEWILYDTEYVRKLSLRMDLLVCFKTVKKLTKSFLDQF